MRISHYLWHKKELANIRNLLERRNARHKEILLHLIHVSTEMQLIDDLPNRSSNDFFEILFIYLFTSAAIKMIRQANDNVSSVSKIKLH